MTFETMDRLAVGLTLQYMADYKHLEATPQSLAENAYQIYNDLMVHLVRRNLQECARTEGTESSAASGLATPYYDEKTR